MIPLMIALLFSLNALIGTTLAWVDREAEKVVTPCLHEVCINLPKGVETWGRAVTPHIDQNSKEFITGWCNQMLGTNQECI